MSALRVALCPSPAPWGTTWTAPIMTAWWTVCSAQGESTAREWDRTYPGVPVVLVTSAHLAKIHPSLMNTGEECDVWLKNSLTLELFDCRTVWLKTSLTLEQFYFRPVWVWNSFTLDSLSVKLSDCWTVWLWNSLTLDSLTLELFDCGTVWLQNSLKWFHDLNTRIICKRELHASFVCICFCGYLLSHESVILLQFCWVVEKSCIFELTWI